jgi:hypothetical protein
MKVRLRRTGGFAGLVHAGEIDASRLPPGVLERIRAAAREAPKSAAPSPARDAFRYRLEIEGGTDVVEFDDASMTGDEAAVVGAMEALLRPEPRRTPPSGRGPSH